MIEALPTRPSSLPVPWFENEEVADRWWMRLARSPRSLLICDYDGTLAPFRPDKMQAVPYEGVAERLTVLADTPGASVALVSGRPVGELLTLMPLAARLEIFGSHGREHRAADGAYRLTEPSPAARAALDRAEDELRAGGWDEALERKAGSLAAHSRALSPERAVSLHRAAEAAFASHTVAGELAVLPFDGGLELRSTDATKAHAVEQLLGPSPLPDRPTDRPRDEDRPVAYLGDDLTDEDAFRALGDRGLSLLVRASPRASLAPYLLRPPEELLAFLDRWLDAARQASEA